MTRQNLGRLTRRGFLHVSGIGAFGITLPHLLRLEAEARAAGRTTRPKSLIFLNLYGGPSQIDIWDMKPNAPEEYRGEFRPIATTVPGIQICEHLPRMARLARHYSIIRTLHHANRNHQPAGCYLLTGVDPQSDNAAQLAPKASDPPALGSLVVRLDPRGAGGVPPFIMMPARLHDQGSAFRGQAGGWLGSAYDPLLIAQDPNSTSFRVDGFEPQKGVPPDRLGRRRDLLHILDQGGLNEEPGIRPMNEFQEKAFDLLTSRKGQSAFNLSSEPDKVRDRYGRNMFGQGCLLARRLIEAGARVVTVSDCTINGHHEWDTHHGNFKKLKETLLPRLDQAYSALMEDLIERGLLEETVVYLGGEFGRTPRVGQGGVSGAGAGKDGRDHYPNCFCGIIAGGLSRPGTVYGESDAKAAYPARDGVKPEDLAATLFAAMGLDPHALITARDGRPMPLTHGKPIAALLR
ncbi:MAG TPA: DUF1501 domain-containing protein [Gemmataceae bacterium]|nr:DUF1501 domain-containing protein [Gemmataceae bacterium]